MASAAAITLPPSKPPRCRHPTPAEPSGGYASSASKPPARCLLAAWKPRLERRQRPGRAGYLGASWRRPLIPDWVYGWNRMFMDSHRCVKFRAVARQPPSGPDTPRPHRRTAGPLVRFPRTAQDAAGQGTTREGRYCRGTVQAGSQDRPIRLPRRLYASLGRRSRPPGRHHRSARMPFGSLRGAPGAHLAKRSGGTPHQSTSRKKGMQSSRRNVARLAAPSPHKHGGGRRLRRQYWCRTGTAAIR